MEERRRSKRMELDAKIMVKRLDEDTAEEIIIEIVDISKTGAGFNCKTPLTIGAIYEAYLTIWTKEVIDAVIEIVRRKDVEDGYEYGAEFIGMTDTDALKIDIYQIFNEL